MKQFRNHPPVLFLQYCGVELRESITDDDSESADAASRSTTQVTSTDRASGGAEDKQGDEDPPREGSRFRYVVARYKNEQVQLGQSGEFVGPPDLTTEEAWNEIGATCCQARSKPKKVVLLLPRAELEQHQLNLPVAEDDELPSLVANLVAESTDDPDGVVSDFLTYDDPMSADTGKQALTWSFPRSRRARIEKSARSAGLRLQSLTYGGLGSIALWRELITNSYNNAVVITAPRGGIDFAVVTHGQLQQLRYVPFPGDDLSRVSDRLVNELRRTMALLGGGDSEDESSRIFLLGSTDRNKPIAEALGNEFDVPVSILNPLDQVEMADARIPRERSEAFSHLIGIAKGWFGGRMDIDLCHPRTGKQNQFPWKRVATWAAILLLSVGALGYVIYDDIRAQTEELNERQTYLNQIAPEARRVLAMRDELSAIRSWRAGEIVWLDKLNQLSRKLPPRELSLIRRINMASGTDGTAKIDLSVEVRKPELVLGLENALKQENQDNRVKSKRVSESRDAVGTKWNFETSVTFPIQSPKLKFVEPEPVPPSDVDESANAESDSGIIETQKTESPEEIETPDKTEARRSKAAAAKPATSGKPDSKSKLPENQSESDDE